MLGILYIAYHFPPKGGAGVQRSLKFIKHLPAYGVNPTVLTSLINDNESWSPLDDSMSSEIPETVRVHRAPWAFKEQNRFGFQELEAHGIQIAQESKAEAVFVSMSPFHDTHLAESISRENGIPWIADLRDPWALDEFQVHKTRFHRRAELKKMGRQLQSAAAIIMNTPEAAKQLREAKLVPSSTPIFSITNGFDEEDFKPAPPSVNNSEFTIVHTGHFHTGQGLRQVKRKLEYLALGRTKGKVNFLSRSPYYLMQALDLWASRASRVMDKLRVRFIGPISSDDQGIIDQSKASAIVDTPGYLSHGDSVKALQSANLLFLPMHSLPDGTRSTIVPGKAYEYMAAAAPILAAVPQGDAQDFLIKSGLGLICRPDDPEAMASILSAQFKKWKAEEKPPTPNSDYIRKFERKELSKELASVIKSVLQHRLSSPKAQSPNTF